MQRCRYMFFEHIVLKLILNQEYVKNGSIFVPTKTKGVVSGSFSINFL